MAKDAISIERRLEQRTASPLFLLLANTRRPLNSPLPSAPEDEYGEHKASVEDPLRQVPYERAKRFASSQGMLYLEVDVGNIDAVDQCFARLAEECLSMQRMAAGTWFDGVHGSSTGQSQNTNCALM